MEFTEQPRCPDCGLVMSFREAGEQGACNECYGGAYDPDIYERETMDAFLDEDDWWDNEE